MSLKLLICVKISSNKYDVIFISLSMVLLALSNFTVEQRHWA